MDGKPNRRNGAYEWVPGEGGKKVVVRSESEDEREKRNFFRPNLKPVSRL